MRASGPPRKGKLWPVLRSPYYGEISSLGSRTLLVERVAYCMHNTGSCLVAKCICIQSIVFHFFSPSALPPLYYLIACQPVLSDVREHGNENGDRFFLLANQSRESFL